MNKMESPRASRKMRMGCALLIVICSAWQRSKILQMYELQSLSEPPSAGLPEFPAGTSASNTITQIPQLSMSAGPTPQQSPQHSDISQSLKQLFDSLQALEPAPQINSTNVTTVPLPHHLLTYAYRREYATQPNDVTMVTQGSPSKLDRLRHLLARWNGPISCTAVISSHEDIVRLADFWNSNTIVRLYVSIHVYMEQQPNTQGYPINIARNIALDHIDSDYFLANDIDFIPDPAAFSILSAANKQELKQRVFWVLPAFERFLSKENKEALVDDVALIPKDKSTLLKMVKEEVLEPFHPYTSGHRPTNITRWYNTTKDYEIKFKMYYEPYVVGYKFGAPQYWPTFRNFGFNKAAWFMEADRMGYKFNVLANHFVVHMNHPGRSRRRRDQRVDQSKKMLNEYLKKWY